MVKKVIPKKRRRSKKKKNYTVFVLDESGSMASMYQEAIDAVNEHIQDLKEGTEGTEIESRMSLVTFSSEVNEPVFWNKAASKVREITKEDYSPGGMTAMLDAVGYTIDRLREEKDIDKSNTSVLVVVVSDGGENNSQVFNYADIAEKIQDCQKTDRWTFTYAGANQDLSELSKRMHIPVGNFQRFSATKRGMKGASAGRKMATKSYLSSITHGVYGSSKQFYSSVGASDGDTFVKDSTSEDTQPES